MGKFFNILSSHLLDLEQEPEVDVVVKAIACKKASVKCSNGSVLPFFEVKVEQFLLLLRKSSVSSFLTSIP